MFTLIQCAGALSKRAAAPTVTPAPTVAPPGQPIAGVAPAMKAPAIGGTAGVKPPANPVTPMKAAADQLAQGKSMKNIERFSRPTDSANSQSVNKTMADNYARGMSDPMSNTQPYQVDPATKQATTPGTWGQIGSNVGMALGSVGKVLPRW